MRNTAKPGRLLGRWSNRQNDFLFSYPRSCDGHWLYGLLCFLKDEDTGKTVVQELEARGYDTKTLRFQVDRKLEPVA